MNETVSGCHAKTWRQASRRKAISIIRHGPRGTYCARIPDANYYFGEPSWFLTVSNG